MFSLFTQSRQTGERTELAAVTDPTWGNGSDGRGEAWWYVQSGSLGRGAGAAWARVPALPAQFAGSEKGLSETRKKLQLGKTNREETLKLNFTIKAREEIILEKGKNLN